MYQNLIKSYINNLSINDVYNYCNKENISISEVDAKIIYNYIKTYGIDILRNPLFYLEDIKGKVDNNIYLNLVSIYEKNKKKLLLFKGD